MIRAAVGERDIPSAVRTEPVKKAEDYKWLSAKGHIIKCTLLLCVLSGCGPGSNTDIHNYSLQHSGVATVTNVFNKNGETYIDFLWQAENNIGDPEAISQVNVKDIEGHAYSKGIKAGDRLYLDVTHHFRQRGSTTPEIVKSIWVMRH